MAGRRLLYLLALAGCLTFYVSYQEWFSWILLLTVLLFPWLSLVLSLGTMLRFLMEPTAAPRILIGSSESIQLKVTTKDPQPPIKTRIRITKPLTGEKWTMKPDDKLPTAHCGALIAQLHKPIVCDYLGLFRLRIRKTAKQSFLVLPTPIPMELPPDLTQYLARAWRPKPGGGYAENHEIRQYHPGDNLNQIHWKLSAKVGDLMLREPMEPERGLMLLTVDLCGSPSELDTKFGRLLWLGSWFLEQGIPFEIRALTGNGIETYAVSDEWNFQTCIENLLSAPFAPDGTIRERNFTATWQNHIGGEPDEG